MARNFVSLIFTDKLTKKEYVVTAGNGQGDDLVAEVSCMFTCLKYCLFL